MGQGVVETAIQAVVAAVGPGAISLANGYNTDVAYLSRHIINMGRLDDAQVPAVFVTRPDAVSPIENREGYCRQNLRLEVYGYLRSDGEDPDAYQMATKAENFLSDLKSALTRDDTFGGTNKTFIHASKILEDASDAGWDRRSARVAVAVELILFYTATAP